MQVILSVVSLFPSNWNHNHLCPCASLEVSTTEVVLVDGLMLGFSYSVELVFSVAPMGKSLCDETSVNSPDVAIAIVCESVFLSILW